MWFHADMATGEATGEDKGAEGVASVGTVVGENLRRIRETQKLTQHEAARRCQAVGLNWSRSRLADVERGFRETIDVGTLLLLATAFDVPVSELFAGDGLVQLATKGTQTRSGTRRLLSSRDTWRELPPKDQPESARVADTAIEADAALADRLGVSTTRVLDMATRIFRGLSLTQERDRRIAALGNLDTGERAAHRGHITRELGRLLEEVIELDGAYTRLLAEWEGMKERAEIQPSPDINSADTQTADKSIESWVQGHPAINTQWLLGANRRTAYDLEEGIVNLRSRLMDAGLPVPELPDELKHLDPEYW